MLTQCPYCESEVTGHRRLEILDDEPAPMHVSTDPGGVGGIQTVELTEGVRFKPCGHAFTRESVDEIVELCEQWETDRREIMREYRHPEETRELLTLGSETFMREVRNTYERVEAADRTNAEQ